MGTWIDRDRHAPSCGAELDAVDLDVDRSRLASRMNNGQMAKLRLELVDPIQRDLLAIGIALSPRYGHDVVVLRPRRRGLALLLMAHRQIEQRPRRGVEALTLGELRTRLVVAMRAQKGSTLIEERLCDRA